MHIEFELRELDDIAPWGDSDSQRLHWFGLTDGLYRIRAGSDYLLSYSEAVRAPFAREYPEAYSGPCVDYYVVRLWEDLLDMLPYVLEPVPSELVHFFDRDFSDIIAFLDGVDEWWDAQNAAEEPVAGHDDIADAATLWQSHRFLDNAYLSPSARLWMWSEENVVKIAWDNRGISKDGEPVWSAQRGVYSLSRDSFLEAIRAFDRAFMAQMANRVDQVCEHWSRPEIRIDFEWLRKEHDGRSKELQNALDKRDRFATDWVAVGEAITKIGLR